MDSLKRFQFQTDFVVGLLTAMTAVCTLVAMSDVDAKYKLALVAVIGGTAALAFLPERRVICIALWALLHPLGIEKIFYVDAAESPQFTEPAIIFNASDGPLALLALILVAEVVVLRREAFRWSRMTTILLMFLVWSIVSFAIHATYLDDGFTASAPYALLQDVRLLIFALLVQSAIRVAATSCWCCWPSGWRCFCRPGSWLSPIRQAKFSTTQAQCSQQARQNCRASTPREVGSCCGPREPSAKSMSRQFSTRS
jgi:hypothetical protein